VVGFSPVAEGAYGLPRYVTSEGFEPSVCSAYYHPKCWMETGERKNKEESNEPVVQYFDVALGL
jgi:hypothetical protein